MKQYIKFDDAKKYILSNVTPLHIELIDLKNSLFRVLAEDCYSKYYVPNYNNSAMDGFAVRSKETENANNTNPIKLKIVEELSAGKLFFKTTNKKNVCIKIMTGSLIPKSFDSVIEKEKVKEENGYINIFSPVKMFNHIRFKGEDIKKGERVLSKGTVISPFELGILISCGYQKVKVYQTPKVAIIATGNELVDINDDVPFGKVKNVNSYTLTGLLKKYNFVSLNFGIVKDSYVTLKKTILKMLKVADVVLISGGVSHGEYDFVKPVLIDIGVKPIFWEVRQRPGKPLFFGIMKNKKYIFGIPGNVVSNITVFETLIKPALFKLAGRNDFNQENYFDAILEEPIKKKAGLKYFLRGIYKYKNGKFYVKTTGSQGSGILKSMILANCLIILSEQDIELNPGNIVKIMIL